MSSNNAAGKSLLFTQAMAAVAAANNTILHPSGPLLKNPIRVGMYYSDRELYSLVPANQIENLEKDLATAIRGPGSNGFIFMSMALYRKMFSYIFGDPSGKTDEKTEG